MKSIIKNIKEIGIGFGISALAALVSYIFWLGFMWLDSYLPEHFWVVSAIAFLSLSFFWIVGHYINKVSARNNKAYGINE